MPAVTAAVSAGAAWYAAQTVAVQFMVRMVATFVISAVISSLTKPKKPKTPFSSFKTDRTLSIRQPIGSHQSIYGEARKGGTMVYASKKGDKLHMIIVHAAHEVEEIGDIYFGEEIVPLDGSGNATGKYADYAKVAKHLGASDQVADSDLISAIPEEWTSAHRLRGRAYTYVWIKKNQDLFPSGAPSVSALIKGKKIYDPRTTTVVWSQNAALCLSDYLTDTNIGLGVDYGSEINETELTAAANVCDEQVILADSVGDNLASNGNFDAEGSPEEWTKGSGWAIAGGKAVGTATTADLGQAGILESDLAYEVIFTLSDYVGGDVAINLGTVAGTTRSANGTYTETVTSDGADFAFNAGTSFTGNIDNVSIKLISEDRYHCDGITDADTPHKDALADLQSAMMGSTIWSHGDWYIRAGAYTVPTVTLDENDLRAPFKIRTRIPRNELCNAIKGVFTSPDNNWQPADFPVITNSTYESQDNSERLWKDIELPFTINPAMAQRVAKIVLERTRQQISGTLHCKLSALQMIAGDVFSLTYDRFGWSSKPFEVEDWRFVVYDDADGAPALGVDLAIREIASTVYDWNDGEETTVDAAPDTNLPDPFTVETPGNLVLDSGTAQLLTGDGSVISRIYATWDAMPDGFIGTYQAQYKKTADSDWIPVTMLVADTTAIYISPVEDGVSYDVRVRAVSALGVRGSWATSAPHVVIGKTAAPSAPDSLQVARLADGTRQFTYSHASQDADVRAGGGYHIRYYVGDTSDWSAMTALHEGLLTSSPYETNDLAAGTYTFAVKSVDSSGNESDSAIFASSVTLGDPRLKNVLYSRYDNGENWPGTLTGCWDYNNVLIATSSQDYTDLPATIGGLAGTIEQMLDNTDPITYDTPEIDLGSDLSWTPLLSGVAQGAVTYYMKTGDTGDGGVVGSWVIPAAVTGMRYAQFRISVTHADMAKISQFSSLIDGESITEYYEDVNTATETESWYAGAASPKTGHFIIASKGDISSISQAKIVAIQNVGAGWTWELISKTQTLGSPAEVAAEFKIYNSSDVLADAVIDVELRGPKK